MKKKILAAVVAAASVLSLAGCNESGTSSGSGNSTPAANSGANSAATNSGANSTATSTPATDLKDDDDKLSILAWSSNEDVPLLIDFFCEKTGISKDKVEWVKVGNKGEEAREQYAQYLKGDGDADLIFCDADWTQLYASNSDIAPLSELGITKDQYPNAYKYTLAVGTSAEGEFKGATWQATPGAFVYNAKAAEQYLGVKTPEEMQAMVKDWDTLKATAKTLKEKSDGKCKILATEGGLWQVRQAALSKPWVVDGKFSMDSVANEFYDMAKEFADNGWLDPNVGQWTTAWYNAVNDGSALGDFVPTWGLKGGSGSILYNFAAGGSADADGNFVANEKAATDLLSACEGPQGWFWGGTYMMPTAKCNTKATAKKWIELFTQDEAAMKEYAEKNGDFMNNSKVMSNVSFKNPVLIGNQDHFKILVEKAKDIDLDGKVSKYDSQIKGFFNDSVNALLKGTDGVTDKDSAIKFCKTKIAETITDITVE